jgi:hypothetical protein
MDGHPAEQMAVWDPNEERGGITDEQIRGAKISEGPCPVQPLHPRYADRRGRSWRKVIVHPECFEVA